MATLELPLTTVGGIAAADPAFARVLEGLGIDYCCSGGRTLHDACRDRGLDTAEVVDALRSASRNPDERRWREATLTELADHIERAHHDYLRAELPRLAQIVHKVEAAHRDRDERLSELRDVFTRFATDLAEHMEKEERVLFPAVRALERGAAPNSGAAAPIETLMHEHDDAGAALRRMRELTDGFVPSANACTTWRVMLASLAQLESDMHQHVHLENNILFPGAERLATEFGRGV